MNICSGFQRTVDCFGDEIALDDGSQKISYRELNLRAETLARHLMDSTVDSPWIPVLVSDPASQVIAILGVLKVGRGWVYLSSSYPLAQLEQLIADCESTLIIADDETRSLLGERQGRTYIDINNCCPFEDGVLAESHPSPQSFACLMYTSGSTGKPKGALHSHENLLHVAAKTINACEIGYRDNIGMLSPLGHVVGVAAMMVGLLSGATLHLINVSQLGIPLIADRLRLKKITYFHTVPTVFRKLGIHLQRNPLLDLRVMAIGGERVDIEDVLLFRSCTSESAKLRNLYGATESIDSLEYMLERTAPVESSLPIGSPCSSSEQAMIDETVVNEDGTGELLISSEYLALGYWKDEVLTAEKFPEIEGKRWYRTGDLVRRNEAAQLVLVGRVDDLVKIHGQRISTGAVESAILSLEGIVEAAVVCTSESATGASQLTAYYVTDNGTNPQKVRDHLAVNYPAYYIPAASERLDVLPQLLSGKVDYKALAKRISTQVTQGFFEIDWQHFRVEPVKNAGVTVMLRCDRDDFADRIERLFEERSIPLGVVIVGDMQKKMSSSKIRIRADEKIDLEGFLNYFLEHCGPIKHVVDALYYEGDPSDTNLKNYFDGVKQAVGLTLTLQSRPMLTMVTRNAHYIEGQDEVMALSALKWGISRTLPREDPRLRVRLVDIGFDCRAEDLLVALDMSGEDQIAIRTGKLFVARLCQRQTDVPGTLDIKPGGAFLVSGGLGDLGFAIARMLVEKGIPAIYLIGRRPPGEKEKKLIAEIETFSGQIRTLSADVSDPAQVQHCVDLIDGAGERLKGIIHAAGTADFVLFQDQGLDRFREVFKPKAVGAWNLHRASSGLIIEHFYLISSVTSFLGLIGHADYCAANAYLDALAWERRLKGLPCGSIRLGTLEGGMAEKVEVQNWMAREGLYPISLEDAANSLRAFQSDCTTAAYMSVNLDKAARNRERLGGGAFFEHVAAHTSKEYQGTPRDNKETETILRDIFAEILGKKLDADVNFFTAGGDSLGLIELHLSISEKLNADLPITLVASNATAKNLARLLDDQWKNENSHIVAVRSSGNLTPIIVINDSGGAHRLKKFTSNDQPIYYLSIFDFIDEFEGRLDQKNTDELARRFADCILEAGYSDIILMSYCQSGLLAIETTRHLEAASMNVSLNLIDVLLRRDEIEVKRGRLALWQKRIVLFSIQNLILNCFYRLLQRLNNKARNSYPDNYERLYKSFLEEAFSSNPKPINSDVVLLYTTDWIFRDRSVLEVAIGSATAVHHLDSFHNTLYEWPYGKYIAKILSASD
jgi:amino acid adenylation domain-containing protein